MSRDTPIRMLGLIGGTGLGEALFGEVTGTDHVIDTPFGSTSSPVRLVSWNGIDVAILARHGDGHVFPPSMVPYRANLFALKKLGVTHLLTSGAVGSLHKKYRPRDLVLVDQIIDKTHRRAPTFFDDAMAVHSNSRSRIARPSGRGSRLGARVVKPDEQAFSALRLECWESEP